MKEKRKLLAFNAILTEKYKRDFDENIIKKITDGFPFEVLHLGRQIESNLDSLSRFSHLLISGSSLSAATGSEYDELIFKVIHSFLKEEKPILGICYGHQMIARAILGDAACRRAKIPEFGWRKIKITSNPLFEGIEDPIFLESHYDEVCNLTKDFKVIACNKNCHVQAFQYRDLPVWGVQFHPEMSLQNGSEMVEDHITKNPQDNRYYFNEKLLKKYKLEKNFKMFHNFFNFI